VAYLIDGNNFIGYLSPSDLKDPKTKYSLVSRLFIFQRTKKTRVLLVFDGTADLNLIGKKFQKKSFSVIFPPPDQNADGVIKEIISKQTDLRRFFVVSSDREIQDFAKSKGANSMSCKEFNREFKTALKEHKKSQELEKTFAPPSPLEINQWLKIFKAKK
jgi:predicted RNA-binding protein with PIN domain